MTQQDVAPQQTVETVVGAYTQAELALAEVSGAVAQFRAASDQLAAAEAQSATAAEALTAATSASERVAGQLEQVVASLGETVSALRAVDPDRLWAHLETAKESHRAADERHREDHDLAYKRSRTILVAAAVGALAALLSAGIAVLTVLGVLGA